MAKILIHHEKGVPPTSEEIAKKLESKKEAVQAEALEELILLMINGESGASKLALKLALS